MALTTQQQQQLQSELQQPAYQSLSDADAAALASTPSLVPVPYATFQTGMMQLACWGKIRVAAVTPGIDPTVLGYCLTAIDLLTNYKAATVDMSLPAFAAAMSGLVAANLVTTPEQSEILAMGQVYPIGVAVQASDVTAARAANAQAATVQALVAKVQAAEGAALVLINAYANGPASGTPPTGTQLTQAFSAQVGS